MKTYLIKLRIPISVAVLLSGLVWIWLSRLPEGSKSNSLEAAQVGFSAPGFALTNLDDQKIELVDFKGNPVILNFWASWCPPCKAEMPAFQQASLEFSDSDLRIIAINATSQDSLAEVKQFIEEHEITFLIPLDMTGSTSRHYLVHSLPTTYFIDRNGVIVDVIIGGPIPLSLLRIQANQLITE